MNGVECTKGEDVAMDLLILISPTIDYAEDIMLFRAELLEAKDADAFAGCGVGDASLEECTDIEKWLNALSRQEQQETCPEGGVPSNFYLAVRVSDNKIIGGIDLRHHIDHPILGTWGGHMGYSVRPSERGKGYAKEMLRLNLLNCKARGIDKVLVTCSRENPASEKVILANGGVFEKEIDVDGEYIKRYWITL